MPHTAIVKCSARDLGGSSNDNNSNKEKVVKMRIWIRRWAGIEIWMMLLDVDQLMRRPDGALTQGVRSVKAAVVFVERKPKFKEQL